MNNLLEKYLSHNLSIIGTRPANGKLPFISNLIIEMLKDKSKKILLFGLDGPDTYNVKYLLNNLTNIDLRYLINISTLLKILLKQS